MVVEGGTQWISESIRNGSLVAITKGLYIKQLYPNLCVAAFVLECTKGHGQIFSSFPEATLATNLYRGELLYLMAIHLILVNVNKMYTNLEGSVEVVSGCLGALKQVADLPPYWISSHCKHSDILKKILVNCRDLTFTLCYSHKSPSRGQSGL
jgi:hypothetical protein